MKFSKEEIVYVPIEKVIPYANNPRKTIYALLLIVSWRCTVPHNRKMRLYPGESVMRLLSVLKHGYAVPCLFSAQE